MNRAQALNMIYRLTPKDYKGTAADGARSLMLRAAEGGGLCLLDNLTDAQILDRLPIQYRKLYAVEQATS